MSKIKNIISREILDSRGIPSLETEIHLNDGSIGISSVPSGASKSSKEALELRDNDINRFFGKGLLKCIYNIENKIKPILLGLDSSDQYKIDNLMINIDGTKNKSNLGSNSILSVSLALAKAHSMSKNIPLYLYISQLYGNEIFKYINPSPMVNIINGGLHSDNNLDIQEFMIKINSFSFKNSIRIASEIFYNMKYILKNMNLNTNVGDEGGYAPNINSNEECFNIILESIFKSNYNINNDISICIDCAASEFYNKNNNLYYLSGEKKYMNLYDFTNYLKNISEKYYINSIEDGVYENDWDGAVYQTKILNKLQLVGDDIFSTNNIFLKKGIELKAYNAILIKCNQIGTLSETLETIKLANKNNYNVIISHRSGETEDTFISDLAIGTLSNQIKFGSVSRSERLSKYNRIIRIEEKYL